MAEPLPLPTPAQLVTLSALLIPLMRVSLLIVSMGIVACADALCRAFFGTLDGAIGWVPFLGRVAAQPIHAIEKKVTNYLGGLESHIDVSMGGYIHALADAAGRLASGEAEAGWALYLYGKVIGALRAAVNTLPSLGTVHTITRTVVKQTRVIVREVHTVGKLAAHAAPASVVGAVHAIAGTLDDVVTWDIPRLRSRTKALERRVDRLYKRLRVDAKPIVGAAFAGAVAIALSRLGLGWARCSRVKKLGRSVCGMDESLLESLLADALVIAGSISIVELARECQAITGTAEAALKSFVREL